MAQYFEVRRNNCAIDTTIAADIMRHFHARQYLGQAVIICPHPTAMATAATRQWLKITRTLQRRRLATGRADDILKYTYTITHMQNLRIATEPPQTSDEAGLYIIRPEQLANLPADCLTVYLVMELPDTLLPRLIHFLPASSLVVDYYDQVQRGDFGLAPKAELEQRVATSWRKAEAFLAGRGISLKYLTAGQPHHLDLNDILDNLLEVNAEFLQLASAFQYQLDIAQPLRNAFKSEREHYDLFVLLAHHIQTLTPGMTSTRFLRSYNEDAFFLRDHEHPHETWKEQIARHNQAGRRRLAHALEQLTRKLGRHNPEGFSF
jgi:hypothetical protein